MAKDKNFTGTIGYTKQDIAGLTIYSGKTSEKTLEEVLDDTDKAEVLSARKDLLLKKLKEKQGDTPKKEESPKRYLVDVETGKIDVVEDGEGEYTYKDALLVSASIKSKTGHYDDALSLIKAAKELSELGQKVEVKEEKKKEYYVDQDTGVITHDPDNGEYTFSEARGISQSIQRSMARPAPSYLVDDDGNVKELPPGQPAVVKQKTQVPPSPKTYLLSPSGELKEIEPGEPIVIKIKESSNPGPLLELASYKDKDGHPLVATLDQFISLKKLESEEKRADDRQKSLMGLVETVKENMADGIRAFQMAAAEMKGKGQSTKEAATQVQAYECGNCHTKFTLPREPVEGENVECPNCHAKFTREEVMAK